MYVSLCDFYLFRFAFTICPWVLTVHLFVCFCFLFMSVCAYVYLCDFVRSVLLLPFGLGFYQFVGFLFSFFFFLPSHVAGRVLVLQPGVRPEPLK